LDFERRLRFLAGAKRDRKKFYHIALSSCREGQAIVELAKLTGLTEIADGAGAHLSRLCKTD
jgi:hypothetical protein